MAMSDCDHCWETPCSCGYAYWFMPLDKLKELARVTRKVLGDRRGHRRPPGAVREEMERRKTAGATRLNAADFHRRVDIPARLVDDAEVRAMGDRLRAAAISLSVDQVITDVLSAGLTGRCGGERLCRLCTFARAPEGCGKDL